MTVQLTEQAALFDTRGSLESLHFSCRVLDIFCGIQESLAFFRQAIVSIICRALQTVYGVNTPRSICYRTRKPNQSQERPERLHLSHMLQ